MHIECEKGSLSHPGSDRARARPARRGPAAKPAPTPSRPQAAQPTATLTLDRVLAAAARRRAPVSIETAGYIALAVADVLAAAPAVVLPAHVHLTHDGDVMLRGARRGDEHASAQSVRALLAELLTVAVGASPALTSAARRTTHHSLEALIEELEAGLIPVNRAAARRAIGRLAREVERSGVEVPANRVAPPAAISSKPRRPEPPRPRSPAPPPLETPELASVQEEIPSIDVADATDIDASVAPVAVVSLPVPATPAAQPETCDGADDTETPLLVLGDEAIESSEDLEPEVEEDDLLTYEPPAASGDESLDFGTASPPLAEPILEAVAEAVPQAIEEPNLEAIEAPISEATEAPIPRGAGEAIAGPEAEAVVVAQPEGPRRVRGSQVGPDRVNELLADFGCPERSSRELAGELKTMLGLPPTPAPPQAQASSDEDASPGSGETSNGEAPPAPLELRPPRHPRLGLAITTVLLLLAVAGMVALYALYPALLFGR